MHLIDKLAIIVITKHFKTIKHVDKYKIYNYFTIKPHR